MPLFRPGAVLAALTFSACAHSPLSPGDLDRVRAPAFISRIEENAGPMAEVFRSDGSYRERLKSLDAQEADRRLAAKLKTGMTRFEVSEGLRTQTLSELPQGEPWTSSVNPARVAGALQSFLVEEVPANAPDYNLMRPLGADAVVEFVVTRFGMRSSGGRAGTFLEGYGRLFSLSGGGNLWYRAIRIDDVSSGQPHLDPFKVAKEPNGFRDRMLTLVSTVASQFAKDLNPPGAARRAAEQPALEQLKQGFGPQKMQRPTDAPGELPEADPL